jgi:putative glycosyltransferase
VKLFIAAALYRSSASITKVHAGATAAAIIADQIEMILVNDGSPDDRLARVLELAHEDASSEEEFVR